MALILCPGYYCLNIEQASHILFFWFSQELDYKVIYMVRKITSKALILSVCGIQCNASDLDKKNRSIHKHLPQVTIIIITINNNNIILFISSYIF